MCMGVLLLWCCSYRRMCAAARLCYAAMLLLASYDVQAYSAVTLSLTFASLFAPRPPLLSKQHTHTHRFESVVATQDFVAADFDTLKHIVSHLQATAAAAAAPKAADSNGNNADAGSGGGADGAADGSGAGGGVVVSDEDVFRAAWKWTTSDPSHCSHMDAVLKLVRVPPTISLKEIMEATPQGSGLAAAAMAAVAAAAAGGGGGAGGQQQQQQNEDGTDNGPARSEPLSGAAGPAASGDQHQLQRAGSTEPTAAAAAATPNKLTVDVKQEPCGAASSAHNTSQQPQGTLSSFDPHSGQPTPTSKALLGGAHDGNAMFGAGGGNSGATGPRGSSAAADMAAAAAAAGMDPMALAAAAAAAASGQLDPQQFAAMYGNGGAAAGGGAGGGPEGSASGAEGGDGGGSPGKMSAWSGNPAMAMHNMQMMAAAAAGYGMPGMMMGHGHPMVMPGYPGHGGGHMGGGGGGGGSRNHAKGVCQVEGCNADLRGLRDYHLRYKICEHHLKVGTK